MTQHQINQNLTFDSLTRELRSSSLPEQKKKLGLPAAFCLETLIKSGGGIVSQQQLIHEGWNKHGLEVSSGNVRQVISQIRKAFISLREDPDMLVTVPKMGYRLKVNTTISDSQPTDTLLPPPGGI